MQNELSDMVLGDMGEQLLMAGGLADVEAFIYQIDSVTTEDVNLVSYLTQLISPFILIFRSFNLLERLFFFFFFFFLNIFIQKKKIWIFLFILKIYLINSTWIAR